MYYTIYKCFQKPPTEFSRIPKVYFGITTERNNGRINIRKRVGQSINVCLMTIQKLIIIIMCWQ